MDHGLTPSDSLRTRLSLILAILAVSAIQLSFLFNGVNFIDGFALLLIPAFILFLFHVFLAWPRETNDYRASLCLLSLCMLASLWVKSHFRVATCDDTYHLPQIAAHSIRNGFSTIWGYRFTNHEQYFLVAFVESLWGIFWRFTHWDFIIVLLQCLPLLVVWCQLVEFFRLEGPAEVSGLLSLAVILSLQVFWCQQGSGYVDATAGIFAALTVLGMWRLLGHGPGKPCAALIAGVACTASLAMISKISFLVVSLCAYGVLVWSAFRYLKPYQIILVLMIMGLGTGYLFDHYYQIWLMKGNPFYPFNAPHLAHSYRNRVHIYYDHHPVLVWLVNHHLDFTPVCLLASWLFDYKYRTWITPDPWVGGNGVLWTYLVVPAFLVFLFKIIKNPGEFIQNLKTPKVLILAIILFYACFFSGSLANRFMVGFYVFILAWVLSRLFLQVGFSRLILALGLVAAAGGNYYFAIQGAMLGPKGAGKSSVAEELHNFPKSITPFGYSV